MFQIIGSPKNIWARFRNLLLWIWNPGFMWISIQFVFHLFCTIWRKETFKLMFMELFFIFRHLEYNVINFGSYFCFRKYLCKTLIYMHIYINRDSYIEIHTCIYTYNDTYVYTHIHNVTKIYIHIYIYMTNIS